MSEKVQKAYWNIVDELGEVQAVGFDSKKEAKNARGNSQFVVRSEYHPLGPSKRCHRTANFRTMVDEKTGEIKEKIRIS